MTEAMEPWGETVELKEILADLLECNQRHVYQEENGMFVDAMYVVLTYTFEAFDFCPIVYITSPVSGCGKSTNLDWFEKYCNRPVMAGNITSSPLFRLMDAEKPTMLIDEFDSISDPETKKAIMNILNNGFQKGKRVFRSDRGDNGGHSPTSFDPYGPKVVACIGASQFSAASSSRSIHKRMQKRPKGQGRPPRVSKIDSKELKSKCQRWAMDNKELIEKKVTAGLYVPDKLSDREADVWEGLFILSTFAGEDWETRIYNAAHALSGSCKEDTISLQEQILQHCQDYILTERTERISSEDLVEYINCQNDWKENCYHTLTKTKLATLLRDFGVSPMPIHFSEKAGKKLRGYYAYTFEKAFKAYLPPLPSD